MMTPQQEAIQAINVDIQRNLEALQGAVNRAMSNIKRGAEPRSVLLSEIRTCGVDQLVIERYVATISKLSHAAHCIALMPVSSFNEPTVTEEKVRAKV